MKKLKSSFFLALVVAAMCSITACGKNGQTSTITQPEITFISDTTVDFSNVSALGIKRDGNYTKNEQTKNTSCNNPQITVQPLRISLFADTKTDNEVSVPNKNYLYSTTQSYSNGNVEYDSSSVFKVEFQKHGDTADTSKENITQEEIPAQINRVFVSEEYTFMQFVAVVDKSGTYKYYDDNGDIKEEYVEIRPNGLTYDEYGVADFDKTNYYSSALSQSFIVDNATGRIYKIEDIIIKGFHNRFLKDNNGSYFNIIIENDNLILLDVLPNKDVEIDNIYKDPYGWTFVANEKIDDKLTDKKIIYTTNLDLMVDDTHTVYYVPHEGNNGIMGLYQNGVLTNYNSDRFIWGLRYLHDNDNLFRGSAIIGTYYDTLIYDLFHIGSTITSNLTHIVTSKFINTWWFNNKSDFIIWHDSENSFLGYLSIDLTECTSSAISYTKNDFIVLSDKKLTAQENYYMQIGNDRYKISNVYYYTGINGTDYYQIVQNDNQLELKELSSIEYNENVFIFQPIN